VALQTGDEIQDWVIKDILGKGGMGAVYQCHNKLVPEVLAAVKVVKPQANTDHSQIRERFFQEIRSLHALHHPAIVRVLGFGEDTTHHVLWMAMELVVGNEISEVIRQGPMDPIEATRFLIPLAQGLQRAHEQGIFHRDIKPANIIKNVQGNAKLVDFGIAVQDGGPRLTAHGYLIGTLAYMPPEVFSEVTGEPRLADVYGLGQVFYEMLVGEVTFPEDPLISTEQSIARIMRKKDGITALDPARGLPEVLRQLVQDATHMNPEERIPDMATFANRLQAALQQMEASTTPITAAMPIPKAKEEHTVPPEPAKKTTGPRPINPPPAQAPKSAGSPLKKVLFVIAVLVIGTVIVGGVGTSLLLGDSDQDGLARIFDACPEHPEDSTPPLDEDGCPDGDGDGVPDPTDLCLTLEGSADAAEPGCPPDTDGDGFRDPEDFCIDAAEDRNDPAPEDGCPDTDSDGLTDPDDDCPDMAGPMDGETPGCPPDTDEDGVYDPNDNCPESSEDGNAPHVDDGCPDTDSDGITDEDDPCVEDAGSGDAVRPGCPADVDGDGIVDGEDQCPDRAEDVDGDRDSDGCPDTVTGSTMDSEDLMGFLDSCRSLASNEGEAIRYSIRVSIRNGQVTSANPKYAETPFRNCVTQKIKSWRFPSTWTLSGRVFWDLSSSEFSVPEP